MAPETLSQKVDALNEEANKLNVDAPDAADAIKKLGANAANILTQLEQEKAETVREALGKLSSLRATLAQKMLDAEKSRLSSPRALLAELHGKMDAVLNRASATSAAETTIATAPALPETAGDKLVKDCAGGKKPELDAAALKTLASKQEQEKLTAWAKNPSTHPEHVSAMIVAMEAARPKAETDVRKTIESLITDLRKTQVLGDRPLSEKELAAVAVLPLLTEHALTIFLKKWIPDWIKNFLPAQWKERLKKTEDASNDFKKFGGETGAQFMTVSTLKKNKSAIELVAGRGDGRATELMKQKYAAEITARLKLPNGATATEEQRSKEEKTYRFETYVEEFVAKYAAAHASLGKSRTTMLWIVQGLPPMAEAPAAGAQPQQKPPANPPAAPAGNPPANPQNPPK